MKIIYHTMDAELIEACIKEDRAAQNRLYERFYGRMLGVCLRYANSKDEAREILNEGFLKVFRTIQHFKNEKGSLEAWIYRVMVNTSIDHYRKEIRYKEVLEEAPEMFGTPPADVISKMSADELLQLVQQLTPAYRTVFNLYVMEGMNHREIGEKLGISEGTSKSNLAKARIKLQQMVLANNIVKQQSYA
ncbi:MAG: sigma-70 family RNA polymerase sigma factor [Chitinophagales bacterium]|nr:sigma-70 family RNA polymerase sigma factor [Chitinophagales bacterium]